MEQNKAGPNGLPTEYQIYISDDNSEEGKELINNKAATKGHSHGRHRTYGSSGYYHIKENMWFYYGTKRTDIAEISYEDWKKALTEPSTGYKVGDWITILNGGCRVGPGMQGHKLVGNSYQISSVDRQTPTEWKYTLEGNPVQTSAIVWDKATMGSQPYIRPAAPEEIAKATGIPLPTESKEWVPKVGEWVVTTSTEYNYTENGETGKVGTVYQVQEVLKDKAGDWYRRTKGATDGAKVISLRPATSEEIRKAQSKNGKEWVCTSEDGVELYDGNMGYWTELKEGTWKWCTTCHISKAHIAKGCSLTTGNFKVFSTEQAAKEWISRQSTSGECREPWSPIPVTDGQVRNTAKIGQNATCRAGNYKGQWGEIVKMDKGFWYDLKMKDEEVVTCYPSEIEEIRVNKSIINSQTKTKTNSYGNITESDADSVRAIKLSSITRTVGRSTEGPAVAIRRKKQPKRVVRVY